MEELGALFSPGMRHEQQRRQDLEMLRDEEGNAADPPSTVDLDRGIAVIRLPRPATPPPDAEDDAEADATELDSAEADAEHDDEPAGTEPAGTEPTAATGNGAAPAPEPAEEAQAKPG
jgi:hypothetical protein